MCFSAGRRVCSEQGSVSSFSGAISGWASRTGGMVIGCCQQQWLRLLLLWLCICTLAVAQPAEIPPLSSLLGATDSCGIAVCFAIDASGSIGSTNFQKSKLFVVNVIDGVSTIATGAAGAVWISAHHLRC